MNLIILDADGDNSLSVLIIRLEQDGADSGKLTTEIVHQFERDNRAVR